MVSLGLCSCRFNWSWTLLAARGVQGLPPGRAALSPVGLSLGMPPAKSPPRGMPFGIGLLVTPLRGALLLLPINPALI